RRVERLDVLLRLAAERQAGADHRQAADADGRRQRAAGDEAPAVARGALLLRLRLILFGRGLDRLVEVGDRLLAVGDDLLGAGDLALELARVEVLPRLVAARVLLEVGDVEADRRLLDRRRQRLLV